MNEHEKKLDLPAQRTEEGIMDKTTACKKDKALCTALYTGGYSTIDKMRAGGKHSGSWFKSFQPRMP